MDLNNKSRNERHYKDYERNYYGVAGISLAGIYLILGINQNSLELLWALYLFSANLPICITLILSTSLLNEENSFSVEGFSRYIIKDPIHLLANLLPSIITMVGIGLIVKHISTIAFQIYVLFSLLGVIYFVYFLFSFSTFKSSAELTLEENENYLVTGKTGTTYKVQLLQRMKTGRVIILLNGERRIESHSLNEAINDVVVKYEKVGTDVLVK